MFKRNFPFLTQSYKRQLRSEYGIKQKNNQEQLHDDHCFCNPRIKGRESLEIPDPKTFPQQPNKIVHSLSTATSIHAIHPILYLFICLNSHFLIVSIHFFPWMAWICWPYLFYPLTETSYSYNKYQDHLHTAVLFVISITCHFPAFVRSNKSESYLSVFHGRHGLEAPALPDQSIPFPYKI